MLIELDMNGNIMVYDSQNAVHIVVYDSQNAENIMGYEWKYHGL